MSEIFEDGTISTEYMKRKTVELTMHSYGCSVCMTDHVMAAGSMQMLEWFASHNPARSYTEWAAKWYCPAALHQTIEVPLTWWDHWKRDKAPKWLQKRWPWKKRVYEILEMFPEIAWPRNMGHKMNVAIMTDGYARWGPDVVQHPQLGQLFGAIISATCSKCGKDIYCVDPGDPLLGPPEKLAQSIRLGTLHHYQFECPGRPR